MSAPCLWFCVVNCGEDVLINIYDARIRCQVEPLSETFAADGDWYESVAW